MLSPIPHLAAIGSFLTILLFIALSAFSSWVQKREERNKAPGPPRPKGVITPLPRQPDIHPPLANEPQPSTMDDWEKQIRRWVGEPEEIQPAPTPPPYTLPPIVRKIPPEIKHRSQKVGPDIQLTTMPASTAAYREGSELTGATARRIHGLDNLTSAHAPAPGRTHADRRSPEAAAAVSQIKHHRTIRQALLASIILGPPKSLEHG